MRPSSSCLCEHVSAIHTETRFIILMHPKEYRKEKIGTGRMTNLQLENSEIIVGIDFTEHSRVNELINQGDNSSFLLYPGKDSFNLSTRKSSEINSFMGSERNIFILDGTWSCANKMLRLSKNLQKLRRVSFDNSITSKFVIKQQPESLCLSTIESVYTVVNLLKKAGLEQSDTKGFLKPFEKMVEHQVDCFLDPNNRNFPPNTHRVVAPKNVYQRDEKRSIIFEQER